MEDRDYYSDTRAFRLKTLRRILAELTIVAILGWLFLSDLTNTWPTWLEGTVFGICVLDIGYGICMCPSARKIATSFTVSLRDQYLVITFNDHKRTIAYRDVKVEKVHVANGRTSLLRLRMSSGIAVDLTDMVGMDQLHKDLLERTESYGDLAVDE